MLDLNHLANFMAVARQGSYSRAASEVHLSQPALSRSIQALEKAVGKTLLVRSRGGVSLTEPGRIVAEHAAILLREKQRLIDELANVDAAPGGSIRIGLGAYAANGSGIEAASCLLQDNGQMKGQLRVSDYRGIIEDLLAHRIDLGHCDLGVASEDDRFCCIPLRREQLFPYTRPQHPLHLRKAIEARDLVRFPVFSTRVPMRLDRVVSREEFPSVDELTGEALPALNVVAPELLLKLLLETDAVAFATLPMIERLLAPGTVALVPLREPALALEQGFIHLADYPPGALALRYMQRVRELDARVAERSRELEEKYGVAAP